MKIKFLPVILFALISATSIAEIKSPDHFFEQALFHAKGLSQIQTD